MLPSREKKSVHLCISDSALEPALAAAFPGCSAAVLSGAVKCAQLKCFWKLPVSEFGLLCQCEASDCFYHLFFK